MSDDDGMVLVRTWSELRGGELWRIPRDQVDRMADACELEWMQALNFCVWEAQLAYTP